MVLVECLYGMADFMVPPLERSEYLYELRNVAENVVRERCEHSEAHPRGLSGHGPVECGEESVPESSPNMSTPLGPAFHIPMTQDKSLEDLPSQIDFEWHDSVSPNIAPALATGTGTARTETQDNTFGEVSQIAEEAILQATQRRAEEEEGAPPQIAEKHEAPQPVTEEQEARENASHPNTSLDVSS